MAERCVEKVSWGRGSAKAAAIQRAKVEAFDRIMEAREYEENAAYPPGSYTHGVIEEEHDRIANLIEEN